MSINHQTILQQIQGGAPPEVQGGAPAPAANVGAARVVRGGNFEAGRDPPPVAPPPRRAIRLRGLHAAQVASGRFLRARDGDYGSLKFRDADYGSGRNPVPLRQQRRSAADAAVAAAPPDEDPAFLFPEQPAAAEVVPAGAAAATWLAGRSPAAELPLVVSSGGVPGDPAAAADRRAVVPANSWTQMFTGAAVLLRNSRDPVDLFRQIDVAVPVEARTNFMRLARRGLSALSSRWGVTPPRRYRDKWRLAVMAIVHQTRIEREEFRRKLKEAMDAKKLKKLEEFRRREAEQASDLIKFQRNKNAFLLSLERDEAEEMERWTRRQQQVMALLVCVMAVWIALADNLSSAEFMRLLNEAQEATGRFFIGYTEITPRGTEIHHASVIQEGYEAFRDALADWWDPPQTVAGQARAILSDWANGFSSWLGNEPSMSKMRPVDLTHVDLKPNTTRTTRTTSAKFNRAAPTVKDSAPAIRQLFFSN